MDRSKSRKAAKDSWRGFLLVWYSLTRGDRHTLILAIVVYALLATMWLAFNL